MNRHATFAVVIVAVGLAACGMRPPTEQENTVASKCSDSRGVYRGTMTYCIAEKACSSADITLAESIQRDAAAWCAKNPATTPANMDVIQDFIDRQRAVGRGK